MSSDDITRTSVAAVRNTGIGHYSRWHCMGCHVWRDSMIGSKGAGLRKRCAVCVRAKEAVPA